MEVHSFEKFLAVAGEREALEAYQEVPFPNFRYDTLLHFFHQFCLIGGIPDVVEQFVKEGTIGNLPARYDHHLEQLFARANQSVFTRVKRERVQQVFQDAFVFAGTRITFRGFGNAGYRGREIASVFRHLESLSLIHLIYPTTSTTLPWIIDHARHPRIQLPDTGLVNYFTGIQEALSEAKDLSGVFNRQISLHVVAQELMNAKTDRQETTGQLHFWVRNKTQSTAEIDFVIDHSGWMIPVEVKRGGPGRLRSLHQFVDASPHAYAIRLHAGPLSVQETRTLRGKTYYLMNLPYFLAGKIREHLEGFMKFVGK